MTLPADDPSCAIPYGLNPLDRRSEKRGNAAELEAARSHPHARAYLLAGDRVLLAGGDDAAAHAPDLARGLGVELATAMLLGWQADGAPRLAGALPAGMEPPAGMEFVDLRSIAAEARVSPGVLGQLAQARSMLAWHARHGFCANCGHATAIAIGGYRRDCPSCAAQHFPRVDPVAIMLVTDGERALLGRQAHFRAGSYSCLAGFVEPGETLEDAVRRETFEEAGIRVGRVRFHASQPWPFVSSLMLGCIGEALSAEIVMDETELEDCRWFPREEVIRMVRGDHPGGLACPPRLAIARHLIEHWLAGG